MKIKRRTLTLVVRWTIRLSSITLVTLFLYGYFGTQFFAITSYQISGVDEDTRASIDTQLHLLDKQKLYKVFPADKIFTYSGDTITKIVRDIVPEMATIDIRPVGLHTLKIEVSLLKPIFRISNSQAVTSDGIIFSTKYNIGMYPLIEIASSTTKVIKDDGIHFTQFVLPTEDTTTDFFESLSDLSGKISSIIFPVERIIIENTGDVSYYNDKGTSKVLLLEDSDFKKVWSTLVSAVDTDPLKTKLSTNRDGLLYLDVRYGNKVFYRFNDMAFQNGSVTGILGDHGTTTSSTSTLPR